MPRASMQLAAVGALLASALSLQAGNQPRSPQPPAARARGVQLRRRAMFGAQLAPVTEEVRVRQKVDGDSGVLLEQVIPGTSAAEAGFKAGDVILAVNGARVTGIPMFLEKIAAARA